MCLGVIVELQEGQYIDSYPIIMFLLLQRTGMILSSKEKTGKLCNIKSGRPTHVLRHCAVLGGMLPPKNIYFQRGFLDF